MAFQPGDVFVKQVTSAALFWLSYIQFKLLAVLLTNVHLSFPESESDLGVTSIRSTLLWFRFNMSDTTKLNEVPMCAVPPSL